MDNLLKPFGSQSFFVGLGVAAAAYFLGPQIKETIRPMAVKSTQGMMMMTDKTMRMMHEGKDRVEDMVGKMGNMARPDHIPMEQMGMMEVMLRELKEERERSNKMMEEFRETLMSIRDEISGSSKSGDTAGDLM
ncbi:hypothetical protein [Geosporobacter ferrireducens]|uniref:hypothetical protein n=1 Tax=Geosporobacter ferrireducens TaxID=1424294 RepID=UPI00139AF6AB|nr:hypothetical protein [Geosporobacter ferrireducens]MTI57694.1 hypothetical protein [Geosporobacter ferrireducens]